jgi:hypothetical protein
MSVQIKKGVYLSKRRRVQFRAVLLFAMRQSEWLSRHARPHFLTVASAPARKIDSGGKFAVAAINRTFCVA